LIPLPSLVQAVETRAGILPDTGDVFWEDGEEIGNALVFEGDVWGDRLYLLWAQPDGFGNVVPIGDAVLVDKVYVTAVGGRGGGFEEDGGGLLGADPSDLLPEALGGPDELDNLFGLQAGLIGLCELKWQAFERGVAVCSFDIQ
jgi:hypothetical protein